MTKKLIKKDCEIGTTHSQLVDPTLDGNKLPKCKVTKAGLVQAQKHDVDPDGVFIDDQGRIYIISSVNKDGGEYEEIDYETEEIEYYSFCRFRDDYNKRIFLFSRKGMTDTELFEALRTREQDSSKMNMQLYNSETEEISTSTELTTSMGKEAMIGMRSLVEKKQNQIEIHRRFLERMANNLGSIVSKFNDKIEKLTEVIDTIELYLGIHEDVYRLKTGENASVDTPISFRQQVLFMDEEVGDPEDGGWDFTNFEEFDKWLIDSDNYKNLIPEEKGIVVMKPRRYDKDYGDPFTNASKNAENKKTFFLIRNGENLYQIWTSIGVNDRMFPLINEFEKIKEERSWYSESDMEKDKKQFAKQALMFQGIIDRTEIFKPMPPGINLMKPQTYKDHIVFIRDDEVALPTGRLTWRKWKEQINSKIKRGSRILYVTPGWGDKKYYQNRLPYGYHDLPGTGIYKVDKPKDYKEDEFRFVFNPGGTVYKGWEYHERKKGYGIIIERSDENIFNYDMLNLDDIEFYLNCRSERHNYLDMMPLLRKIRKDRIKEIKWEQEFVRLVMERTGATKKMVLKALTWWKYKNIWKRPVKEDDSKALRMIESKVKKNMLKP